MKAFITGITGQDGSWLAKLLLEKGYTVYGGVRRSSSPNLYRLEFLDIVDKVNLLDFDLTDASSANEIINKYKPNEVYNLAAQSFVGTSFKQPHTTIEINTNGVLNLLEAIRTISPETKFYQASTSEMFGKVQTIPQNEDTPFYPRSPYGVAKLAAHWMTINYKESYNVFATSGILFNHESELRGDEFVTKKIAKAAATWKNNSGELLELGNLDSKRDWGYAPEYVEGMWRMMQQEYPDNYVLATGITTTIRDFVRLAFESIGVEVIFDGKGTDEKGIDKKTGKTLLKVNPEFYRPAEVDLLIGDSAKAKNLLNWVPKVTVEELAQKMVRYEIERKKI